MQHRSIESVKDANHPSVGRDEDLFPIIAEFESSPVTDATKPHFKGGKWTLFTETVHIQGLKQENIYEPEKLSKD